MTDGEEKRARKRLRDDFQLYARECLRIRAKAAAGKAGAIKPLTLNRVQRHLHERIERQLKRTGKVRAIILKGRQQGCSTYVEARYYWKVTHSFGSRAFIVVRTDRDIWRAAEMMVERYGGSIKGSQTGICAKY